MSALELELVDKAGTKYMSDQDLKDEDDMSSVESMREVALEAIQAGDVAELNRLRCGWTLVHVAVRYKDVGLMRDLLPAGADGNVPNVDGWCPIHDAAFDGTGHGSFAD
jgi:ankyrin repeat protein